MGTWLYIVTYDDYVQPFKQTTLYYYFKKGGPLGQRLNKSEILLRKTT
jgi:hypothetical protein